jgi:pheromone shutdown protein TraB
VVRTVITLVGVGHVFDLRSAIRRAIEERRPAVVGVELDPARFADLSTQERRRSALGLYGILAYIQRRIASEYGTRVGGEMIAAAEAAKEFGARLAFLDLDSRAILARLLRAMTWPERARFALSVVGGLFIRKSTVEKELQRFEEDEDAFLEDLGKNFPSVKRVLIDERNAHMARAVRALEAELGSVVAVVGEGHVEGLRRLLADRSPEIVRLRDLRRPPPGNATATASFTARGADLP